MSVIVSRALPDVRDGLKPVAAPHPLRDGRAGPAADELVPEVRRRSSVRCMGKYHPHGDVSALRRAGAPGAGLLDALPARRRAGQLRLGRRRPAGGDALHGGAAHADRRGAARRHRQGHGRLRRPTTTARSKRALPSCRPGSRTCSSTAAPASRSAWRPTSRRTTWARSCDATIALIDNPEATVDDLLRVRHTARTSRPGGDLPLRAPANAADRRMGDGRRDPPAYADGRGRVVMRAQVAFEDVKGDRDQPSS